MKKIFFIMSLFLLTGTTMSYAQLSQEQIKERKANLKLSKAELSEKASKAARKEAKSLQKQGWQSAPGALPVEKQLDKSYTMQMEYDETLFPKYIMAEAMSTGENYDAAKMQATELAKQGIASLIQTEVTALINNTVSNKQLEADEAASVVQSISAAKNLISQSLGRTISVVEVYRTLPNKNKEVLVRLAYSQEQAKAAAKKAIREDLEKQGEALHNKLDKALGW